VHLSSSVSDVSVHCDRTLDTRMIFQIGAMISFHCGVFWTEHHVQEQKCYRIFGRLAEVDPEEGGSRYLRNVDSISYILLQWYTHHAMQ